MQATRVLFDEKKVGGDVQATGVEFTLSNVTTGLTFSAVSPALFLLLNDNS